MSEAATPSSDKNAARPRSSLPVNRIRPAYEQVAEQVRELIVQGVLVPGDRLPVEADLAATFGVSRGTLREALRLLASRNLVYAVRGATGGTFVADSDAAAISEYLEMGIGLLSGSEAITLGELLEARLLLEVPAARLAAQRRTEEHIAGLRAALEEEVAEGGVRFLHHKHFHALILTASGNGLLEMMTPPIFGVIRSRFVIEEPAGSGAWHQLDEDHAVIFECIAAGDEVRAGDAMHQHLLRLNEIYEGINAARAHG